MADLTELAAGHCICGMLTGDATGPESNGYPASLTICGATGPGRASPSGAAGAPVTEVTQGSCGGPSVDQLIRPRQQ
jgi:hypothetical protein